MPRPSPRARRGALLSLLLFLCATPALAGDVVPPEVLTRVEAQVPPGAPPPEQDHVLLEFTVGTDGRPSELLVVESAGRAWDQASLDALAQWTFRPARHEGQPVAARTRLSFNMPVALMVAPDAGAHPADDAGQPDAGPVITADAPDAGHPRHEFASTVLGRGLPRSRGTSDFAVEVGQLQAVPRRSAADFLKLAPGILLTNEGGEGHPERIFLRGFDAREGQDLELTVDGVPINDSGNLHGNGYADLGFLIPELVESLRVLEGPFDPRQGNFAVAGSADYQLGLPERGLVVKGTYGSFDTTRLVALWGPPGETSRTYGGVQLFRTAGFGQSREAQNAKVMAQYEGSLGEHTSFRVGALGYGALYKSAGVLRVDEVERGLRGFFDTADARQGGDSLRAQVHLDLHGHGGAFTWDHTVFALARATRVQENFTGFLTDPQLPQQTPHPQRGDLLDRDSSGLSAGSRGSARYRARLFDRNQELEAGYFARFDSVRGVQYRVEAGGNVPYARDYDLDSKLSDVGAYVDANLSPVWWLTVRGGLRGEFLTYNVHDLCAVKEVRRPSLSDPPLDQSCLTQRDFGRWREPSERASTSGAALLPRVSLLLGPVAGVTLSGSVGTGVRSIDPQFISENLKAPFASIFSWEGGAAWQRRFDAWDASVRGAVFGTRVDKDLVFSEQEGRGILGGSTTRLGALLAARGRGEAFDVSGNLTWVQSRFDDTGLLVPYVPDLVARLDGAVFHAVPWVRPLGSELRARAGLGATWVGRRALPYGQRSDVIFVVDLSGELEWRGLSLGVAATNLLDSRYRQAEYNFASDFRTQGALPTLVPARHFAAGAPRAVLVTLAVHLGGEP